MVKHLKELQSLIFKMLLCRCQFLYSCEIWALHSCWLKFSSEQFRVHADLLIPREAREGQVVRCQNILPLTVEEKERNLQDKRKHCDLPYIVHCPCSYLLFFIFIFTFLWTPLMFKDSSTRLSAKLNDWQVLLRLPFYLNAILFFHLPRNTSLLFVLTLLLALILVVFFCIWWALTWETLQTVFTSQPSYFNLRFSFYSPISMCIFSLL